MVNILTADRVAETFGGECRWGLRACDDWEVTRGFSVGVDGCRTDWITIANELRRSVEFDLDGWPYLECSARRMTLSEASSLPPLPQLAVRARIMLGADVPVLDMSGGKWSTTAPGDGGVVGVGEE